MRIALLLTIVLALACGCQRPGTVQPSAEPRALGEIAIALERGACFGACPMYRVSLDSSGKVSYEGKRFVRQEGAASGQVPPERVAALAREIEQSGYFALPDSFTAGVPACAPYAADLPSATIDVTIGTRHKRIVHDHGCSGAPAMLDTIERRIDEVAQSNRWTRH